MPQKLKDIVTFRGDRLFNGAVSIDWFGTDQTKSRSASGTFVFHGPQYHGVSQADVGTSHGHRLQDTANFARSVVRRCYGLEDQPFTLAIAGYGTGKSHLGLTLANLLDNPKGPLADTILSSLAAADETLGADIRAVLAESGQPCLVIALNGMQSFDLTAEVTRQVLRHVKDRGLDTRPLDDLRPRFRQAVTLTEMSTDAIVEDLVVACEMEDKKAIVDALERQEEALYAKVQEFFSSRGIPIRALGGESARDVIDVTVREYCGKDKPYRSLVFLFDEFGRYTEFATIRSQIAGSGVLQDLFEGIQANASAVCFVGFIQFELNAYVQRVAAEHKNEILRYVGRYQSANRVYLSINLETLIASLLEKRKHQELNRWFDGKTKVQESARIAETLGRWFPQSRNHRLWGDADQFHAVIRKGCWPLSPYSTWFLFYLAAAGKHLQGRSALALLGDAYERFQNASVPDDGNTSLAPADLWSDGLQQELILSEEGGQQGSVTHAYASVTARHAGRLQEEQNQVLRAVVLASKMGLRAADRRDAIEALSELAGIPPETTAEAVQVLQEEYNVLEWDEAFKEFDILGDAVPRTQFLSFVRHRVASTYDETGKAKLFASKAASWCDLLGDLECDFGEVNKITTREWRYQGVTSSLEFLPTHLKLAADRWVNAIGVDEPRGTIIYCYVEPSRDATVITTDAAKLLKAAARGASAAALPLLVVLLCDEHGALGQALAELAVLDESLSEEDRVRFGNLIGAHKEKMSQLIRSHTDAMIRQRRYVTCLGEELEEERLDRAGTELFSRIYKNPIPFTFDGFSTARGNAADTCQELTAELLLGKLDYDAVIAKPAKAKNRGITVLKDTWGVFSKTGSVLRRPSCPVVRTITEKWDEALAAGEKRLPIAVALQQLCKPPYGANVASAGMLLGVFVAPRSDKLIVVRDGLRIALPQWLQDGALKGRFIDVRAQANTDLMLLGEDSSEWETLLDEWEQAESYSARSECLQRSNELKVRIPVPPTLNYKLIHHEEQGRAAIEAIAKMEKDQNDAIGKLEWGRQRKDVTALSWGAAFLCNVSNRMIAAKPLWTDQDIASLQPHIESAKQAIIQDCREWLKRQAPISDSPGHVGDFKHKMLHLVGRNLETLGLESQLLELQTRTVLVVKDAETAAEARQLVRDVRSWLQTHSDARSTARVAGIRGLLDLGRGYSARLQGMAERIQLLELGEVRSSLAQFLTDLRGFETTIVRRAKKMWRAKIRSESDLDALVPEVEELTAAFENCPDDLKDLHAMRRALRIYQQDYQQLRDERLTWSELESLTAKVKEEAQTVFQAGDLPWATDETIDSFVETVSKQRKEKSDAWIEQLGTEVEAIAAMSAADASRLHVRARSAPAFLSDPHAKRLAKVIKQIEARLDTLAVEWLVEKFRELPESSKKSFLQIISHMSAGT